MDFTKFLTPPPVKVQAVAMPEWGKDAALHVRQLTALEVSEHLKATKDADGVHTNADLVMRSACDERGSPVFKPDDAERIKQWPLAALTRVARVAGKLNLSGSVEDAAKNSEATPSGDSGSA